jgi:hypothetical protein
MQDGNIVLSDVAKEAIFAPAPPGHPALAGVLDGLAALDGAISKAELDQSIDDGAAIRDVVVVYRPPELAGGGIFTPYLRISGRAGFLAVAVDRGRSIRSYKDFRFLLAALDGWKYRGGLRLFPEGHAEIAKLQLPGATPPQG